MNRILICGANGFLGKNLLEYFSKNYQIRAVDLNVPSQTQKNVEWIAADLTRAENVSRVMKDVDVVLQYGAVSTGIRDAIERPYLHVTNNIIMNTLLMQEAFEQKVKRFIFPSCTVMYNAGEKPVKEEDFGGVVDENSVYFGGGSMKVYLENMCKFYSKLGKTKFTAIRQSNLYGPNDKFSLEKSHVFAATITKIMQATDGDNIVVWGDGSETKDFLYVADLISFIEIILQKQQSPFELVNLGSGTSISIKELVHTIIKLSGKNLGVDYDLSKPTRKVSLKIDSTKALNYGWKPQISITEGINKTIKWYEKNIQK